MYNVLLVDDEPLILEGLAYIAEWEEYGFHLAGKAENAEEALRLMEDTRIDLLVTDIKMPGMSGLELIETAKASRPDIKVVILSGFNDFELVKKAATLGIENYLIKPVNKDELSSTLTSVADKLAYTREIANQRVHVKEAIDILRDNVLLRLAQGQIGVHEFSDKNAFLNLKLNGPSFVIAIVRPIRDNLDSPAKSNAQLLNFAIRNVCTETMHTANQIGLDGYVFNDIDDDIVVLVSGRSDDGTYRRLFEAVRLNCTHYLKQELFISIGQPVDRTSDIPRSYSTAKDSVDYSLVLAKQGIITFADSQNQKNDLDESFDEDFALLQRKMITADKTAIGGLIRSLFRKLDGLPSKSPALVYKLTVEILYTMIHGANLGRNVDLLNRKDFLFDVLNRKTLEEISDSVVEAMENILAHAKHKDSLIEEILLYLDSHYGEELSLQGLSSRFHMNTAYLGQLFKKETGKLFSVYLNELRVGKSVELLQNTSLKAKEVALKVGYPNPDYFYKIFKKITGVYPSEYLDGSN